MSYRTRSARRLARTGRRNFFSTIIISILLIYATFFWILPNLINGLDSIKGFLNPNRKIDQNISENPILAPPVLNIPYEATNSSTIDIPGFTSANSKVKIFIDDSLESEVQAGEDGSFTAKNANLNLGTNNIYGKSVDERNQESLPSKTIRLIFDNEKPSLEVTEPGDGKTYSGERKIKVEGKTEVGARVLINDTQAIVSSDGSFSSNVSLNDGENNILIKSIDSASNISEDTKKVIFQP